MKVVVQRCKNASVTIDGKIVGSIDRGLILLVGFTEGDAIDTVLSMVSKIINLRIFDDQNKIMNLSLLDVKGSILSISQFTLYANTKKGNRPSYVDAMKGENAIKFYDLFNEELQKYTKVETGIFGSEMQVSLINDGPVTIILER